MSCVHKHAPVKAVMQWKKKKAHLASVHEMKLFNCQQVAKAQHKTKSDELISEQHHPWSPKLNQVSLERILLHCVPGAASNNRQVSSKPLIDKVHH